MTHVPSSADRPDVSMGKAETSKVSRPGSSTRWKYSLNRCALSEIQHTTQGKKRKLTDH